MTTAVDADAILRCEGIAVAYGDFQALQPTSLSFVPGKIHVLVGQNGAGKTSFARVLAGIIRAKSGRLLDRRFARWRSRVCSAYVRIGLGYCASALYFAAEFHGGGSARICFRQKVRLLVFYAEAIGERLAAGIDTGGDGYPAERAHPRLAD